MFLTESREFGITHRELIKRLHRLAIRGNRWDEVGRSRCNVNQLADKHGDKDDVKDLPNEIMTLDACLLLTR